MHTTIKFHLNEQPFSKFICLLSPTGHTLETHSSEKCRGREPNPTSLLRRRKGVTGSGDGRRKGRGEEQRLTRNHGWKESNVPPEKN